MNPKSTPPLVVAATILFALLSSAQEPDHPAAESGLDRGEVGKHVSFDLPGGGKLVMKYCPGGTFTMGSPKEEAGRQENEVQEEVTVGTPFWMAETECTQGQWEALRFPLSKNRQFQGTNKPVICWDWGQVQQYVFELNKEVPPPAGWKWSLPSEAQWERACRAGSTTRFHFGNDGGGADLKDYAWYADNSGGEPQPVALKKPNPWGLHDMLGNVREWCQDWSGDRVDDQPKDSDEEGPSSKPLLRGGDFRSRANECRSACRNVHENGISPDFGFRVVLTRSPMRARTETKRATSELDIPKEVAAFAERMIESDPELRARYAQLIAPVKAEAGGRFGARPFVAIEWLVPQHVGSFGGEGGTSDTESVYLVLRQLVSGFHRGYSVPANVVAQVSVTEHGDYDMGAGDDFVLRESTVSLHFDGFVDIQVGLDKATSQAEGIGAIEELGGKVTFLPNFGIGFPLDDQISDAALRHLEGLPELERLSLIGDTITDDRLAHLRGLTRLEELDLNNSNVTDAGLVHLKGLANLRRLNLESTKVKDAGLAHLKGMIALESLSLNSCEVTDAGLAHLKGSISMRSLDLGGTRITEGGLNHLKRFSNLETLNLRGLPVTDAGLAHLAEMSKLRALNLSFTEVTDAGVERLQAALRKCKIDR